MGSIIREARIAALRHLIDQLEAFMGAYQPPMLFHIGHLSDDDYCLECAQEVANRVSDEPNIGYVEPYPHVAFEREERVWCDECGVVLQHSLSPQGACEAAKEILRFGYYRSLSPSEAYQAHQILMALHDLARFGTSDDIDEVWSPDYRNAVTLGQMAIAAIRFEPEQLDLFTGKPDGKETDVAPSQCSSSQAHGPDG